VSQFEPLIGALVVLVFSGLVIIFSSKKVRTKYPPVFRKLTAAINLRKAIGLAVEDGTRIHVSLGNGSLVDPANASALAGLSTLDKWPPPVTCRPCAPAAAVICRFLVRMC
jgi:hypothetical protein